MRTLKRSECAVLSLVLKRKWYDMIASGEKREEYRDARPYWHTRLANWEKGRFDDRKWRVVAFSCGYRAPSMFFIAQVAYCFSGEPYPISTLTPRSEWGQSLGVEHFCIKLIERINLED